MKIRNKIGFDVRAAKWHSGSGIGNYTYYVLKYILKKYIEENKYYFFCPGKNNKKSFVEEGNINRMQNMIEERREDFWSQMYNTDWKASSKVNVFHNMINGVGIPKKGYDRLMITIHDLIPYIYPETVDKAHLDYVLKHTPYIIEQTEKIFTVSEHSKRDLIRYFNLKPQKIIVTYLAPEEIYKTIDKHVAKMVVEKKYKITSSFILYLGGFSHRKNIKAILHAYEGIKNKISKDCKLVILGGYSRSYEELRELSEKLNIENEVLFPGFICTEHLPYFYNACEFFLYPSLYEGFGLPPLEAMACGTPVITSNVSSIPEVVGDAAKMIDPHDIEELKEAMIEMMEDEKVREEYSMKGIERAKMFSWEKTAESILKEYEK